MFRSISLTSTTLFAGLLLLPGAAWSQAPAEDGSITLSRDALETRLAQYEQTAESGAYSAALRERAREEAALVRTRLKDGDLHVGDQIALRVEGEDELTATFPVSQGPALVLPTVGTIPLEGVLRSELEAHLTEQLGRFIREPRVQARALFRVTITGAVGKPGFYVVPAVIPVTDALMMAGGPSGRAVLDRIRLERSGKVIWEGAAMQQAITEGRTLDSMSLQAGDVIIVPEKSSGNFWRYALTGASTVVLAVSALSRLF